jgi:hypothetical protein
MSIAPAGWIVSPSDDRVLRQAQALADEKVAQFNAHLNARAALRDRMGMIITIDRADTERSIASLLPSER